MHPTGWDAFIDRVVTHNGMEQGVCFVRRETPNVGRHFRHVCRFTIESSSIGEFGGSAFERRVPTGTLSRVFGAEVVNLEAKGQHADVCARMLAPVAAAGEQTECTRIDVAFDFEVEPDVSPHRVLCSEGPFPFDDRQVSAAGELATGTRYLSKGSERSFLRVYRRDLKEDAGIIEPTMRVELVCGRDLAPVMWRLLYREGREALEFAALAEVEHRWGLRLARHTGRVLSPDPRAPATAPSAVAAIVSCASHWFDLLRSLGVTLDDLAALRTRRDLRPDALRKAHSRARRVRWKGSKRCLLEEARKVLRSWNQ